MTALLRTVIVMTMTGSILAIILFAIKPLLRNRLPKAAQYYLWLVVLAAWLMPVSMFVVLPVSSCVPAFAAAPGMVAERFVVATEEEAYRYTAIEIPEPREDTHNIQANATKQTESPISIAATAFLFVYPFGVLLVLSFYIISYLIFTFLYRRRNLPARPEELTTLSELCKSRLFPLLYRNPLARTPMLFGLFRPVITLPDREYTDSQLRAVLLHELTHLRHCDVLVRWLTLFACAIHWFNPMVWLVRREIGRTCELACDEAIIQNLNTSGKQDYGDTLIYVAADAKMPHVILKTTMCEEKKELKERLGAIMKSKKYTRAAMAVSVVIIATAVFTACALGAGRSAEAIQNAEASAPETTTIGVRESSTGRYLYNEADFREAYDAAVKAMREGTRPKTPAPVSPVETGFAVVPLGAEIYGVDKLAFLPIGERAMTDDEMLALAYEMDGMPFEQLRSLKNSRTEALRFHPLDEIEQNAHYTKFYRFYSMAERVNEIRMESLYRYEGLRPEVKMPDSADTGGPLAFHTGDSIFWIFPVQPMNDEQILQIVDCAYNIYVDYLNHYQIPPEGYLQYDELKALLPDLIVGNNLAPRMPDSAYFVFNYHYDLSPVPTLENLVWICYLSYSDGPDLMLKVNPNDGSLRSCDEYPSGTFLSVPING